MFSYNQLHELLGRKAHELMLAKHISMTRLRDPANWDSPVGLPWMVSELHPDNLMTCGELLTRLLGDRFGDEAIEGILECSESKVMVDRDRLFALLEHFQIKRDAADGWRPNTEHIVPKRSFAGHDYIFLGIIHSVGNLQITEGFVNWLKGNCFPSTGKHADYKSGFDPSQPFRTMKLWERVGGGQDRLLDGQEDPSLAVEKVSVYEMGLLRIATGAAAGMPGSTEETLKEWLWSFGFEKGDVGRLSNAAKEAIIIMRQWMEAPLIAGSNPLLCKAVAAARNNDATALVSAIRSMQREVSWVHSATRAKLLASHIEPLSAAFCSTIQRLAGGATTEQLGVLRPVVPGKCGDKQFGMVGIPQAIFYGHNQGGFLGGRIPQQALTEAAARVRAGSTLTREHAEKLAVVLEANSKKQAADALDRNLGICKALVDSYGTADYPKWGLTSEELAAGVVSLPKKDRASRDPVLAKFLKAMSETRAKRDGGLCDQANALFGLDYPGRGDRVKSAKGNAGKKRGRDGHGSGNIAQFFKPK